MLLKNARLYGLVVSIVIITMVLSPLKLTFAAPEPAPARFGLLTVAAIIGAAKYAQGLASDMIEEASSETQATLMKSEQILDGLIEKLTKEYEGALEVTLDQFDEFSRDQLDRVNVLVQDLIVKLELGLKELNTEILKSIEDISLKIETQLANVQGIAVVVIRGTILAIDKAIFNIAFIVDLVILAVGLIVFIWLIFTRKLPAAPLSRRLVLGGIVLFLVVFGIVLFPQGRAFALTWSGFGEQLQELEAPDIFQVRPDTLIIGETAEVILLGTRLMPNGQPPTVEIASLEAQVIASDEMVAVQVAGLDLNQSTGRQTITLHTANGQEASALITIDTAPPPPPDLVITSFQIVPSSPVVDRPAQARIVVRNEGDRLASSFRVRWRPTADADHPDLTKQISSLETGESEVVALDFAYNSTGTFETVAIADFFEEVDETDETNNRSTRDITVLKQPPVELDPNGSVDVEGGRPPVPVGGGSFNIRCPPGHVVTGLLGNVQGAGQLRRIRRLGALCSLLKPDGTTGPGNPTESYGEGDSSPFRMECPDNTMVIRARGLYSDIILRVISLQVTCSDIGGTEREDLGPFGGTVGRAFERPCPERHVLTGVSGNSGTDIDQIELFTCTPWKYVDP